MKSRSLNQTRRLRRSDQTDAAADGKTRLQLELAAATAETLTSIEQAMGIPTRVEAIRRAIGYYNLLVQETKQGSSIEIITSTGERKRIVVM